MFSSLVDYVEKMDSLGELRCTYFLSPAEVTQIEGGWEKVLVLRLLLEKW